MKIIYKEGDVLDCTEDAIVHGCNAQGVMGSGVAKAIKERYPEAYKAYIASIPLGGMELGRITFHRNEQGFYVFNAITQKYYGRDKSVIYVNYNAIKESFDLLNKFCSEEGISHIALPKIGAGLANGDWSIIEKIIEEECTDVQPVVYILKEQE